MNIISKLFNPFKSKQFESDKISKQQERINSIQQELNRIKHINELMQSVLNLHINSKLDPHICSTNPIQIGNLSLYLVNEVQPSKTLSFKLNLNSVLPTPFIEISDPKLSLLTQEQLIKLSNLLIPLITQAINSSINQNEFNRVLSNINIEELIFQL